jgi:hypothetical protein
VSDNIRSSDDGFVCGILEAWIHHYHVSIRPDDVWFTILVQLNFYVVKHANDPNIRSLFVDSKGKEKIIASASPLREGLKLFPGEVQMASGLDLSKL